MKKLFIITSITICCISTLFAEIPTGATDGVFSIAKEKQVYFSKGNLQYFCNEPTWKFADSQLTFIGKGNENIASDYDGWIDLFGWSNETTNYGTISSINNNDYNGVFFDWGNAPIINGGNSANLWRTLTSDEFLYLLEKRSNASALFSTVKIEETKGLVILPDDWNVPNGVTFVSGCSQWNEVNSVEWEKMQLAGAVFFPMAGARNNVTYFSAAGAYWTASSGEETTNANAFLFSSTESPAKPNIQANYRFLGASVRLVCDVPSTPTAVVEAAETPVYVEGGRVCCERDFRIYDPLGRDVTRLNGSLGGVYIVKVGEKSTKVVVR